MADELLVRMYNVGLGDCIYLRVPDAGRDVHILIDCGNKFGTLELLRAVYPELRRSCRTTARQEAPGPAGGEPSPRGPPQGVSRRTSSRDIKIEHIWLSPAFDRVTQRRRVFTR